MTTDAQINANRENAKLSTGPMSPDGRRKVAMNAVKHNFTGQTCLVHQHEVEDYKKHFESFRKEYRPVGPTEEFLVQSLADLAWSTQKVRCEIQSRTALSGMSSDAAHPNETHTPEITAAWGQAAKSQTNAPTLNTLGIYESRKVRLFNTTRKELMAIQTERKAQQNQELEHAIALRKLDNATREPGDLEWNPSQNGFVCSLEQIDREINLRERFQRLQSRLKNAA
jgi:hypothetical protein